MPERDVVRQAHHEETRRALISFIDQLGVIKKFFNTFVYGKSSTPLLKETLG
jgi:hypothetical protein